MIASLVDVNLHPNDLVARARERNFTNHGEMFSAQSMTEFARECLPFQFHVTLQSHSIKGFGYKFKEYLRNDNLILIPYPFHEPTFFFVLNS